MLSINDGCQMNVELTCRINDAPQLSSYSCVRCVYGGNSKYWIIRRFFLIEAYQIQIYIYIYYNW